MTENIIQRWAESLVRVIGAQGQPLVLDFPPEYFNQVQFGAIRRHEEQMQAAPRPCLKLVIKLFARVRRGVIDDDPRLFIKQAAEGVEAMDDQVAVDRAREHERVEL